MKVIDLLNKIANNENYRPKIKIQLTKLDKEYVYKYNKIYGEYVKENNDEKFGLLSDWCIEKILNEEVEILEDKTEEIEEIQNFTCLTKGNNGEIIKLLNELSICYGEKLNELARAINQIKKYFLAIGVDYGNDCDKETNCMTD